MVAGTLQNNPAAGQFLAGLTSGRGPITITATNGGTGPTHGSAVPMTPTATYTPSTPLPVAATPTLTTPTSTPSTPLPGPATPMPTPASHAPVMIAAASTQPFPAATTLTGRRNDIFLAERGGGVPESPVYPLVGGDAGPSKPQQGQLPVAAAAVNAPPPAELPLAAAVGAAPTPTPAVLQQAATLGSAPAAKDAPGGTPPSVPQPGPEAGAGAVPPPGGTTIELMDLFHNVTALMNSTFADVGQRIGMAIANSTGLSLVSTRPGGTGPHLMMARSTESVPIVASPAWAPAAVGAAAPRTALDAGVSHFGNLLNAAISNATGLPSLPMTGSGATAQTSATKP
jgi:hypothetical protein